MSRWAGTAPRDSGGRSAQAFRRCPRAPVRRHPPAGRRSRLRGQPPPPCYATRPGTNPAEAIDRQEAGAAGVHETCIGRYLIVVSVVLVAVIIAVSLLRGSSAATETLELALVVLVASIPVAMPTVLSATMAVGARALAARRAIVSRLPALEELAGLRYLLLDKTGTLTRNEITVSDAVELTGHDGGDGEDGNPGNGNRVNGDGGDQGLDGAEVIWAAALASQWDGSDPIDLAVLCAVGAGSDGAEGADGQDRRDRTAVCG